MSKAPKQPAPKPTRDELAHYFELEKQRQSLNRQAKDLAKLQGEIEAKALEYVRENGGKARACVVCDYRLTLEHKNGRVEWKTEFLKIAGPEAAEQLVQAAEKTEQIKIEPPL